MPMRSSSLANNPLAITRELDGRYDVVLQVRDNLDLIDQVAGIDFAAILAELESAQDFTGITVVQGETVAWDAVNKILTVPKGDKGDKGDTGDTGLTGPQGIQGPQGIKGDTGLKGDTGSQGPKGFDGVAGAQGLKGDTGDDLTITQITYNGNGTFNWLFSDGTVYVTPSLKGPKGDTGNQGVKGDQGISVHHIKGTSTTDLEGDFGAYSEIDTYTVYGDANETINLGFFRVNNGAAKEGQYGLMYKSTYDTTANGIVDNSEKLEGRTIAQIQADITDTIGASNGIASLDATTKLKRAQVPTMNVTLEGDVSGNFAVDGSLNTTVNVVVQDNSHSHTFSNLTANPTTLSGYGITDADTSAQVSAKISTAVAALVDSSPATLDTLNELAAALGDDPNFATTTSTALGNRVVKNADIVAGTGTKITYDTKGLVTGSTTLSASDIPSLDASKITTGTLSLNTTGSAAKITTARNIAITGDITWSTSFDGSANVTGVGTLANSGVTAGTYKSVTVDSKGRVTGGTNPTTVNGYGLTDVYTKTEVNSLIPTTLPASDVYAWAKVATKPTYTASEVGLGNVTNESKSTMFNNSTLTGTPVSTTATVGTNTTQVATTAFVNAEIANDAVPRVASTDNAIVRFNGTTGDVQNSGVVIEDAGNVGIGVTPSAWRTTQKVLELPGGASLSNYNSTNNIIISSNMYVNNSHQSIYKNNGYATSYVQGATHQWLTAPSGTAGNPITWTEAMTLASSSNLLVGTTVDNGIDKLQVNGSITSKRQSGTVLGSVLCNSHFNDNLAHTLPNSLVDCNMIVEIVSNSGLHTFPIYSFGGAGVTWRFNYLNPSTGTWINTGGNDLSLVFTEQGASPNTYAFSINVNTAIATIQATTKNSPYTITITTI